MLLILAASWLWFDGGDAASFFSRTDATWANIQERGTFRVGLDPSFPPFEQLNAAGAPEGFDVDLASAIAHAWNVKPEIVPMGFDSLVDALKAAQVDAVISAMPYDERLTRDVTYSSPYFESGIRLAVRESSTITGVEGLAGKSVAVEWGSTGDMIARQLQREQKIDLKIVPFESPDAALDGAASGTGVDAVLIDEVSLRIAQGKGVALKAPGPVLESSPYVIITPRKATTLAQSVESALRGLDQEGELSRLEDRWFGAIPSAD